jgi:ketosteroid isomerase-like protein
MAATEPGQVIHEFAVLFNKGDLDGLVSELYEEGAVFNPSPADEPLVGKAAVGQALQGFLGLQGTLSILATRTVQNGDIALTQSRWRLEVPAGDPMENVSAEIVRRQPDGTWRYAIDNPWGQLIVGD